MEERGDHERHETRRDSCRRIPLRLRAPADQLHQPAFRVPEPRSRAPDVRRFPSKRLQQPGRERPRSDSLYDVHAETGVRRAVGADDARRVRPRRAAGTMSVVAVDTARGRLQPTDAEGAAVLSRPGHRLSRSRSGLLNGRLHLQDANDRHAETVARESRFSPP